MALSPNISYSCLLLCSNIIISVVLKSLFIFYAEICVHFSFPSFTGAWWSFTDLSRRQSPVC